jgi:hypothetical protein
LRRLVVDLSNFNDDQLAELWHTAHDSIEAAEKQMKESEPYVTANAVIEEINKIATQRLKDSGASSIATPHGTIHTVSKTTARIMDPELFRSFIVSGRNWDMIDWKANMSSCREYMETSKTPVPGVELSSFRRLSITAPKAPMKRLNNVE